MPRWSGARPGSAAPASSLWAKRLGRGIGIIGRIVGRPAGAPLENPSPAYLDQDSSLEPVCLLPSRQAAPSDFNYINSNPPFSTSAAVARHSSVRYHVQTREHTRVSQHPSSG